MVKLKNIKLIIFDLDDTLYLERDFVMSGFLAVSKFLNKKYEVNFEKSFTLLKKDFDSGLRKKNFNALENTLDLKFDIGELVKIYREHVPSINCCDDANKILPILNLKFKLALISDGFQKTQLNKLKSLNITHFFESIIINDEVKGESKEIGSGFLETMKHFSVKPEETIFIGDNPKKDFFVAKNLGIITIRMKRKGGLYSFIEKEDERYTIENLFELNELIELK